jgi:uncharacterized protein YndB with AHSA1/START domain
MTDIDVHIDEHEPTMTVRGRWDVPVDVLWTLWSDPRRLERWWGPPQYPATVLEHDLVPDGRVSYVMTGPEGDRHHGWWTVVDVDAPHRLEVVDGFADQDGEPDPTLPTSRMVVTIAEHPDGGSEMRMTSYLASREALDELLAMGAQEGLVAALGQVDAIVTDA